MEPFMSGFLLGLGVLGVVFEIHKMTLLVLLIVSFAAYQGTVEAHRHAHEIGCALGIEVAQPYCAGKWD